MKRGPVVVLGFGGLAAAFAFLGSLGLYPPIWVSVSVIWLCAFLTIATGLGYPGLAMLPKWMMLLFFMPLAPLIENITSGLPSYASEMAMVFPLTTDKAIVSLVATIGACGSAALCFGFVLARRPSARPPVEFPNGAPTVGTLFFSTAVIAAAIALWLTLPSTTILQHAYSEVTDGTARPLLDIKFSGVGFLVYVVQFAALLDLTEERHATRRRLKRIAWISSFAIVVITNLLRGGRNPVGLVVAVLMFYLLRSYRQHGISPRRWVNLAIGAVVTLAILTELDSLRIHLVDGSYQPFEGIKEWAFTRQTWMGATWSLFGLSDSYLSGSFSLQRGNTYLNYLLSLPPSILANIVGYERPITDSANPAWWFQGYTVGGLHPTVVPFANFGLVGVGIVMSFTGWFLGRIELLVNDLRFRSQLLYGAAYIGSLFWFWYGDMYGLRAFMGAVAVAYTWPLMQRSSTLTTMSAAHAHPKRRMVKPASPTT